MRETCRDDNQSDNTTLQTLLLAGGFGEVRFPAAARCRAEGVCEDDDVFAGVDEREEEGVDEVEAFAFGGVEFWIVWWVGRDESSAGYWVARLFEVWCEVVVAGGCREGSGDEEDGGEFFGRHGTAHSLPIPNYLFLLKRVL